MKDITTVKELHESLAKFPEDLRILVTCEDGGSVQHFQITDIGKKNGTSRRLDNGKVGFTYDDREGKETVVFIGITSDF
jgi:hypothetical protein